MKTKPSKTANKRVIAAGAVRAKSRPQPEPASAKAVTVAKKTVAKAPPALGRKPTTVAPKRNTSAPKGGAGRQEKREYYDLLLALRGQLVSQVRSLSSATLASTKQAGEELADVGSDNFSREIGLAMMTEDGRKLALIQEALERLSNGTYGVCNDCGKDIAVARLKAIPYTKLCVDCQGVRELQDKYSENGLDDNSMFGDSADTDAPESAAREDEKEEEEEEDAGEEEDDAEA